MERSGPNRYNDYGCLDKGRFTSDDRSGRPSCTFTFEDRSTAMNSRLLFLSDGKDVSDTTSSEKRTSEPSLVLSGAKVDMPWSCSLFESNNKGDELISAVSHVQCQKEADLANDRDGVPASTSRASGKSSMGLGIAKQSCSEVQSGLGSSTAGPLSAASHSAPTKKLRSTGQTPRCQVEGCKTDLASAKDYHRRHKVCAVHSKAARVTVAGQEQRFCQQCSRFHGLSEFDEGKRSCRRRLAGHNERRRKPQPDPLTLSARFLSPFQDSRRMGHLFSDRSAFLSPRIAGASAVWDEQEDFYNSQRKIAWPRMFKYENQASFEYPHPGTGVERHLFFPGRPQHSNDRSSLLLPQSPKCTVPLTNDVTGQRTHHYLQGSVGPIGQSVTLMPPSGAGVLSGLEAIPIGQGFNRVSDSGRALSLQSTTQLWPSQAPVAVSLDTMTMHTGMLSDQATDQIPFAQPIVHGQQHHLDWANEKLLSSSIGTSTASECTGGVSHVMGKGHLEVPFTHGLNNFGNYDGHSLLGTFPGDGSGGEGRVSGYELRYRA